MYVLYKNNVMYVLYKKHVCALFQQSNKQLRTSVVDALSGHMKKRNM